MKYYPLQLSERTVINESCAGGPSVFNTPCLDTKAVYATSAH